jgi:hypothetical protein
LRKPPATINDINALHTQGPVYCSSRALHWAKRSAVDEKRLEWLERRRLKNFNAAQKARIDASIARIGRRRLRWAWRTMDPTLTGSTIELAPGDLRRVHDWLRGRAGVDPDALTARALDRCTWAGALFLARRSTEATALKSVKVALKDEERWRSKASLASSA